MDDHDNEPDVKTERALQGGFDAATEIAALLRNPDDVRRLNRRLDHLLRLHMAIGNIIYAVHAESRT